MMLLLLTLAAVARGAAARPPLGDLESHFTAETESEEVRSAAIKRLLEVFGMEDPPAVHGHKQAPQYMLDLYNTVADVDGVTKDPYLLEGNTVRSFFDKCKALICAAGYYTQCSIIMRRSLMISFVLQCTVNRWSSGSTCPRSLEVRRFSLPSSISSSCDLSQRWRSTDTISARYVPFHKHMGPIGKYLSFRPRRNLLSSPPSHSGQYLSTAGHQQEQQNAGQEAAVFSTHPGPLHRLGSVHHHTSSE